MKQSNESASTGEGRNNSNGYSGTGAVTRGLADKQIDNLFDCDIPGARITAVGQITDQVGGKWTVPATNNFEAGPKAFDLYNQCNGVIPDNLSAVDLSEVPVTDVENEGDTITGFIFADNYFELYINGQLLAVDPVPYTPFNSNVIKFISKRPYTIAVRLIDWEENLGLGSEMMRSKKFHPGDGGFIASFSDGTITGSHWKARRPPSACWFGRA